MQGNGNSHSMAEKGWPGNIRDRAADAARLLSGVQQVSAAEFGLLQGSFAAHAKTAEELLYILLFSQD